MIYVGAVVGYDILMCILCQYTYTDVYCNAILLNHLSNHNLILNMLKFYS